MDSLFHICHSFVIGFWMTQKTSPCHKLMLFGGIALNNMCLEICCVIFWHKYWKNTSCPHNPILSVCRGLLTFSWNTEWCGNKFRVIWIRVLLFSFKPLGHFFHNYKNNWSLRRNNHPLFTGCRYELCSNTILPCHTSLRTLNIKKLGFFLLLCSCIFVIILLNFPLYVSLLGKHSMALGLQTCVFYE